MMNSVMNLFRGSQAVNNTEEALQELPTIQRTRVLSSVSRDSLDSVNVINTPENHKRWQGNQQIVNNAKSKFQVEFEAAQGRGEYIVPAFSEPFSWAQDFINKPLAEQKQEYSLLSSEEVKGDEANFALNQKLQAMKILIEAGEGVKAGQGKSADYNRKAAQCKTTSDLISITRLGTELVTKQSSHYTKTGLDASNPDHYERLQLGTGVINENLQQLRWFGSNPKYQGYVNLLDGNKRQLEHLPNRWLEAMREGAWKPTPMPSQLEPFRVVAPNRTVIPQARTTAAPNRVTAQRVAEPARKVEQARPVQRNDNVGNNDKFKIQDKDPSTWAEAFINMTPEKQSAVFEHSMSNYDEVHRALSAMVEAGAGKEGEARQIAQRAIATDLITIKRLGEELKANLNTPNRSEKIKEINDLIKKNSIYSAYADELGIKNIINAPAPMEEDSDDDDGVRELSKRLAAFKKVI